jgi:hypothetical protein
LDGRPMCLLMSLLAWVLRAVFTSRRSLALENLALRQQLATYPRIQEAAPAQARGEGVLGRALEGLVGLAFGPGSGRASHRDFVASACASALLVLEVREAGASPDPCCVFRRIWALVPA